MFIKGKNMTRREERIKAFEQIYQNLFIEKKDLFCEEDNFSDFTKLLIETVENNKEEIIGDIKTFAKDSYSRIYYIDLAILMLATAEIKYNITPKEVAVNEAVEIAKIYSTDQSPNFINGFLKVMNN